MPSCASSSRYLTVIGLVGGVPLPLWPGCVRPCLKLECVRLALGAPAQAASQPAGGHRARPAKAQLALEEALRDDLRGPAGLLRRLPSAGDASAAERLHAALAKPGPGWWEGLRGSDLDELAEELQAHERHEAVSGVLGWWGSGGGAGGQAMG